MALDTYANLKLSIQAWMARANISADVDDMIDMFEAWVNRNLRVPQMEAEATAAATEYMSLPTGFIELRDIQWQGNPRRQLEYMTPSMADLYDTSASLGTPCFYTIVDDQLRLIPAPDSTTTIRIGYWGKITPLDGTNTTNWMLTLYPDAYLYGPMVHGNMLVHNPEMASIVNGGWDRVMREIQSAGRRRNLGSMLQIRVAQ